MQGQSYTSRSGRRVPRKDFMPIATCCRRQCHDKVDEVNQKILFDSFWAIGNYDEQNMRIAGLMSNVTTKRPLAAAAVRGHYAATWHYKISVAPIAKEFVVCRQFFQKVFGITSDRLRVLHAKLLNGSALHSMRGKHHNRLRISPDVWLLLRGFCESIPHRGSHYSRMSKMKYFENPELNMTQLFSLFEDYYHAVTGSVLNVAFKTFRSYFNSHLEYAFRRPRTDICNLCF
jgi:hypothetical protein